jgi:hypothetical protein
MDDGAAQKLLLITVMSAGLSANATASPILCPYCRQGLRWASLRWFGLGVYECERCGEFPDFRNAVHERPASDMLPSDAKV